MRGIPLHGIPCIWVYLHPDWLAGTRKGRSLASGGQLNRLYYGDNLDVLGQHIKDESVDLVYLDPPFNSNASYNVLFGEQDGTRAAAQITAFEDTWRWDAAAAKAFKQTIHQGGGPADALSAFMVLLGPSDMLAYLSMMAPRLIELRRVLKPTGSIYLHCDPTASHYLKLLMDSIFGPLSFRTEIVWKRSSAHSDAKQGRKQHGRIHDVLLFYTKGNDWTWNGVHTPYDESYVEKFYRHVEPETGRRYTLGDLTGPGGAAKGNPQYEVLGVRRFWRFTQDKMEAMIREGRVVQSKPGAVPRYKRYLDEQPGVPLQDIWSDINPIGAQAAERLGYPTQKPVALLERIIQASSNEGDVVLDPFCGCGTAVDAAQKLNRSWVGIDVTHLAVNLIRHRLRDTYGPGIEEGYQVIGEPTSVADAEQLAAEDPYQFQWWALGLVGARPAETKKGADHGIDGTIYFMDEANAKPKRVIISVKAGRTGSAHLRDLRGVLDREGAEIGVLISMQQPTAPTRKEAASAGFYHSPGWDLDYPRLQLLTVADLLDGRNIEYPPGQQPSFKQAPRDKGRDQTAELPLD